ncbi:MAG: hypothetical protein K6B41_11900 [Butyrivibrio sp.]|nr:hypothetical protein [Butyrivibrio sp.]
MGFRCNRPLAGMAHDRSNVPPYLLQVIPEGAHLYTWSGKEIYYRRKKYTVGPIACGTCLDVKPH